MKAEGPRTATPVAEGDGWATWMSYPEEPMRRASHAIEGEDGWWLVDPVDADDLDDWLAELGEVAGVAVLLDRHARDAAAVAGRHGVDVHAPSTVAEGLAPELDEPVEPVTGELGDTGLEVLELVGNRFWREAALVGDGPGDGETLVVPEAVGTAALFCVPDERLGVHPVLRLRPPRATLGGRDPARILVGHGEPVTEDAAGALVDALSGARRTAPRLYAQALRRLLPV